MSFSFYGTYGCSQHPCTVFISDDWYCVEGSKNINKAPSGYFDNYADLILLVDKKLLLFEYGWIDVEVIEDVDTMTSTKSIETLDQLVAMVGE